MSLTSWLKVNMWGALRWSLSEGFKALPLFNDPHYFIVQALDR